jgi:hypothetical protein
LEGRCWRGVERGAWSVGRGAWSVGRGAWGVGRGEVGWAGAGGLGGVRSEEMGPKEEIFGVFGWVERRKASQPIRFFEDWTIGNRSAVPMFFWQWSVGL